MYTESKKLHLIRYLLEERNEQILKSVEKLLLHSENQSEKRFSTFVNILDKRELADLENNIETGCEQINQSDWN